MSSQDQPTSLSLLERVRRQDEEAWRHLVFLYTPLVATWCARWNVRGQDAEDISQEVFQAVSAGLETFRHDRPGDTFRGWLRGITRYKLLDHLRSRQQQPRAAGGTDAQLHLLQVPEPELPEDTEEDIRGLYHRAWELVRAEFEPRTAEAFWRATVAGQAPDVIAAELGMTPAAVRKAKSRVLLRLRQEVGDMAC